MRSSPTPTRRGSPSGAASPASWHPSQEHARTAACTCGLFSPTASAAPARVVQRRRPHRREPRESPSWRRWRACFGDHDLDGFLLDFVRWPLHWEVELRPGSPTATGQLVRPSHPRALPGGGRSRCCRWMTRSEPDMDHGEPPARWVDFKCHVITSFVAAARKRMTVAAEEPKPLGLVHRAPVPGVGGSACCRSLQGRPT